MEVVDVADDDSDADEEVVGDSDVEVDGGVDTAAPPAAQARDQAALSGGHGGSVASACSVEGCCRPSRRRYVDRRTFTAVMVCCLECAYGVNDEGAGTIIPKNEVNCLN